MALVSAYGLYYTSREYAKVTETQLNAEAFITNITISKNISNPKVVIDILVLNNASQLDIEIYLIEYRVYASDIPISMPFQRDYIGITTSTSGDDLVEAGTSNMYTVPMSLNPTTDQYNKLDDISHNNSGYFVVSGRVHYKISGPSEFQNSVPFYFAGKLGVSP